MKIFGIVGWSGSGKTELLIKLIPELKGRGFTVSTMKHTHHDFDMDQPGKDSYRHRESGAQEVMVASSRRWVLQRELNGEPEFDMDELIERMSEVDILLIEGFKSHKHDKLEVCRPSLGKCKLAADDTSVVAVASDEDISGLRIPLLDLDDVASVADFIIAHLSAVPSGLLMQSGAAE